MSVTVARVEPSIAGVGDYIALMKPRVMSLVVFTALVGLVVAPAHLHPVIGFAAALGSIGLDPILLFLIIVFWTPPHFWALSLYRADDYARAGIPMLPVVAGAKETRRQILLYTLLLAPLGVAPWLLGYAG